MWHADDAVERQPSRKERIKDLSRSGHACYGGTYKGEVVHTNSETTASPKWPSEGLDLYCFVVFDRVYCFLTSVFILLHGFSEIV